MSCDRWVVVVSTVSHMVMPPFAELVRCLSGASSCGADTHADCDHRHFSPIWRELVPMGQGDCPIGGHVPERVVPTRRRYAVACCGNGRVHPQGPAGITLRG